MRIISILLLAGALMSSLPAEASTGYNGDIYYINQVTNGTVLFSLTGSRSTPPACHTVDGRWAFDARTAEGQSRLAILMTAFSLHRKVSIAGTGTCDVWGDTESLQSIVIEQ